MARARSSFGDIRTSPRNQRLLKWLRRKPVPHTVVGETEDGDEKRAVVSLTGPTIWTDVLSVVRDCVHIEAHDKEGNALRVLELEQDDPELQAENELAAAHRVAKAGSVPLISVDIPKLVDNLARNMREVAAESAKQQAGAFKEGFAAMTSVVNLCLGLLVRVDDRMREVEAEAAERAQPIEAAPGDERKQMAMMALQKVMGGGGNGTPAGGVDMGKLMQLLQTLQQPPTPESEQQ